MHFQHLLKKIISTSVGKTNFWLAISGLALSLLLILAAVQLKENFKQLKGNKTQYLVINKKISNEMMGNISKSTFSNEEIEALRKTNFFDSIQGIKTSLFKVKLSVPINTIPLSTDMYFESVPDAYLDVMPKEWKWEPGDGSLQGIAPRFLVDMYNYGFAVGQQLPQLSDTTIGTIPLNFNISNEDGSKTILFKGNIGALSNRFMSILVPESFMDWANANFGFIQSKQATGIVAKAKDPASAVMNDYLKNNGLKTDYGQGRYAHYGVIIKVIETMSKVNGFIFFGFALLVFMMFIQLTIINAKQEINLLTTLGTSPNQLQQFLMKKLLPIYGVTIGIILLVLSIAQIVLAGNTTLIRNEIVLPYILPLQVFITAAIIFGILWAVNYYTVRKFIRKTI
jgi:hypothetical protein